MDDHHGLYPEECRYGHSWELGSGNVLVGWLPCDCVPGELGHLRVRCLGDNGNCPSVFYDPPHEPGREFRSR